MKEIMISIKPQWVEKILNKEKTVEIRKTRPKCELPCKVYIYCTKGEPLVLLPYICDVKGIKKIVNGRIVGEFTLKQISTFDLKGLKFYDLENVVLEKSCLTKKQLKEYIKNNIGYIWHIDDLKVYDTQKELNDFKKQNKCYQNEWIPTENGIDGNPCFECCTLYDLGECDCRCSKMERPPQSWCYCEREDN